MELQKTQKAFILFLQKHFKYCSVAFLLLLNSNSFAQQIVKTFNRDSTSVYLFNQPNPQNKIIPAKFDSVIRIALLYYPDLEKTKIKFRIRKQVSPLTARPTMFSVFRKASKRKYLISISDKTNQQFSAILMGNLSFNSQVGVIGHELAHVSFYNKKRGLYFIKLVFMHLNKNTIDEFEYNTDMRCIDHELGYQLLSWSSEVRSKLNLIKWKGVKQITNNGRERYMNPESIIKEIKQKKIYN